MQNQGDEQSELWKVENGSCSLFEKSRAVRLWFSKLVIHVKIC